MIVITVVDQRPAHRIVDLQDLLIIFNSLSKVRTFKRHILFKFATYLLVNVCICQFTSPFYV